MCLWIEERCTNCLCHTTRIMICYPLINRYLLFSSEQTQDVVESDFDRCPHKKERRLALETPCGNKNCPKRTIYEIEEKGSTDRIWSYEMEDSNSYYG